MKKIDIFCLALAFGISLGIVYLISYEPSIKESDTIKIGMISLEKSSEASNLKSLKNIDSNEIEKEEKIEKQAEEQKQKEKPEEKPKEKKVERKEEKEIATEKSKEKPKPSLADLKKAISSSKPSFNVDDVKKESFNPNKEAAEDLDRILGTVDNTQNLVSGNKMGTIGGKILVKWDKNNRKPTFPETAEYMGKNGTVKIKLKVDSYGNIISYDIEKGSGVPEIDIAIEKVIGDWKINLLRNNREIGGSFYINYSFNLK